MSKRISLEAINNEIANLNRILIGNGTKGLIRKMDEAMTSIIKLKADNSFKMWVYRGSIGGLIAVTTFLATRMFSQ